MTLDEALRRYRAQFGEIPFIWGMKADEALALIEQALRTGHDLEDRKPDILLRLSR